jgi:hypothetical protein
MVIAIVSPEVAHCSTAEASEFHREYHTPNGAQKAPFIVFWQSGF